MDQQQWRQHQAVGSSDFHLSKWQDLTINRDSNCGGWYDQTETRMKAVDGSRTVTISDKKPMEQRSGRSQPHIQLIASPKQYLQISIAT